VHLNLRLAGRALTTIVIGSVPLFGQAHSSNTGAYVPSPANIIGGRPFPVPRGAPPPLGLRAPLSGFTGINPGAYQNNRSGGRRGRGALPLGYLAAPYFYPGYDLGPGYGPGYDEGPSIDPNVQTAMVTQGLLNDQVQRLTAELEQLKSQQAAPPPSQPAPAEVAPAPPTPPITVVLRDGKQIQVQSYAVMGSVLWDFSAQPARKIAISSIDVPASIKATEATGVEFPQIKSTP
jgi:hypothetical protein